MKKITLILSCLLMSLSTNAQSSKQSLVTELFKVTRTDQMAPMMVGTIIKNFRTRATTNISDGYWQEIQNSVDYKDFNVKVREVYLNNYSEEELKELISLYSPGTIEAYKAKSKKVESQLYEIGSAFGKETGVHIQNKLKAYKG